MIFCKSKNRAFCFCPLRFSESDEERGEFSRFCDMCAPENREKRGKPLQSRQANNGVPLKSDKFVSSARNKFNEIENALTKPDVQFRRRQEREAHRLKGFPRRLPVIHFRASAAKPVKGE